MSISLSFVDDIVSLDKLQLPSRYYHFTYVQNYIKLLNIGEGIFPQDKIKTKLSLDDSDVIVATESATKVYPSSKAFGINQISIDLTNSNIEFINDELILYKDAKLLQLLKIKADSNSTFFYADVLSHGRSYESYEFTTIAVKNSFYIDNQLEYLEKYNQEGNRIKDYLKNHQSKHNLFAKIYIKSNKIDYLLYSLNLNKFISFEYTQSKKMLIGVIGGSNMAEVKRTIDSIWKLYRRHLDKKQFNLGKQ